MAKVKKPEGPKGDIFEEIFDMGMSVNDGSVRPTISWGIPTLDMITGGIPMGHLTQLSGKPGYGKTTISSLALAHTISNVKSVPGTPIVIDTERRFNAKWLERNFNIKPKSDKYDTSGDYILVSGTNIQDVWMLIERISKAKVAAGGDIEHPSWISLIIWDSLGNTPHKAEAEEEGVDKDHMMITARKNNQAARSASHYVDDAKIAVLVVNSSYAATDAHGRQIQVHKGGNGVEHFTSVGIDLWKPVPEIIKGGGVKQTLRGRTFKNVSNMRSSGHEFEVKNIITEPGLFFDYNADLASVACAYNIITKEDGTPVSSPAISNLWYKGVSLGKGGAGMQDVSDSLDGMPDVLSEISKTVMECVRENKVYVEDQNDTD